MKNKFIIVFFSFFSVHLMAQTDANYVSGEKIPCEEITIKCYQGRESKFVIRNEMEYQALLNERSPHPDCPSYQLPIIDFTTHTLLGIRTTATGCKEPTWEHNVYYDLQNNKYVFDLFITVYEECARGNPVKIWCLVPKIKDNDLVDFKISKKGYEHK